ncbi:MAG: T9SS type A sorting domain-containing protein [Ignavibacteria bacterium]|nr:T9SS type A sorting domain-containing protein [Ignavibacteria bacterium]
MKKFIIILVLFGFTVFGQFITESEGLNLPTAYNGWLNPPTVAAFAGIQGAGNLLVSTKGVKRYKTTIKSAATASDIIGGIHKWRFTSGPAGDYSNHKWGGTTVVMDVIQGYTHQDTTRNTVTLTDAYWYTVVFRDAGYANTEAIWMQTDAVPITITNVNYSISTPDSPVTVNIASSFVPATTEKIYVRYTTDNWVSSSFIQATGADIVWSAIIPGTGNTGMAGNEFYVMTTTVALPNHTNADLQTINSTDNSGLNYPLPVELTSFTAKVSDNGTVHLNWETATEVSNYGFEIERKSVSSDWIKIGFVEGHGTTNSPKYYSYTDKPVATGKITYRLKQIDNDGQFEYSPEVEILVENLLNGFVLEQNYPNPFNPETSIRFVLKKDTKATLKVYNSLGAEIATLFDGTAEAGRYYDVKFGGGDLASGFYFYRLVAGEYVSVKKMLLMK